jgi:hypothetical protein
LISRILKDSRFRRLAISAINADPVGYAKGS